MRRTLLDIVQDILSAMDSDEVNSINDTAESQQVARAVRNAYLDIVVRANLPEHFDLFELNASNELNKPTLMYRPDNVSEVLWIKYDKREVGDTEPHYQVVTYLSPEEFFSYVLTYQDQNQGDVVRYKIPGPNSSSIDICGLNNKHPNFFTSYNDRMILFDSYNKELDDTLMKNKTICYGQFEPVFNLEDDFIPNLDPKQFQLLFNEAKASCFADLKQVVNERAESKVRKGWVTLQHQKSSVPARPVFRDTLNNYGRRRTNARLRGFYK